MASHIERRKFLATLSATAAGWPLAAGAQHPAMHQPADQKSASEDGSRILTCAIELV
jgi:hypothetical protein